MSSGINMNEYLDLFLQETEEQLNILEVEISKLLDDPSDERIGSIFRAAHTIKGSSRAMGFGNYADLTHEFENVLYKVRDKSLDLDVDSADILIQTVDLMISGKETIANEGVDITPDAEILNALIAIAGGHAGDDTGGQSAILEKVEWSQEVAQSLQLLPSHDGIYEISIQLDSQCGMKWVRIFMAINAMTGFGEILATSPTQDKLEAEEFGLDAHFLLMSTENPAEIHKAISNISEIVNCVIQPYSAKTDIAGKNAVDEVNTQIAQAKEEQVESVAKADPKDSVKSEPKGQTSQTIRVDVSLLDTLMNLVGELVIDRTRLSQIGATIAAKSQNQEQVDALAEATGHLARVTGELQEQIMRARMLPIDTVFQRFPRMVRELSRKLGKQVNMTIEGGETEVDRSVIEGISDPLIHMIRNSVDHGLEGPEDRKAAGKDPVGKVVLSARHKDNAIWVEIVDDGRGIDPEKLRAKAVEKGVMSKDAAARLTDRDAQMLIFHSGFSTAKEVTDVSGRGVGMDIVRANIQSMGGIIDIESTVGVGTRFILKLPLTIAIMGGLLSRVENVDYVLPIGSVLETLALEKLEVKNVGRQPVIVLRGSTVPVLKLRTIFNVPDRFSEESADNYVVVVGSAEQKVGLIVDKLLGEQEVVIKSISKYVGELQGLSGATILGDGKVALIVDVNSILELTRGFEHGS
jgi:two-component system chemotaxis sensor kinase CheA